MLLFLLSYQYKHGIFALFILTLIFVAGCSDAGSGLTCAERVELLAEECSAKYSEVPWISVDDYFDRGKFEEWIIVDVRSEKEQAVSVIPGSINISRFELQEGDMQNKSILVYCTAGCRSGEYVRRLVKRGINAFNLRGGVLEWALKGKPFVTLQGDLTKRVHVYSGKWNVVPEGYEPVWGIVTNL